MKLTQIRLCHGDYMKTIVINRKELRELIRKLKSAIRKRRIIIE